MIQPSRTVSKRKKKNHREPVAIVKKVVDGKQRTERQKRNVTVTVLGGHATTPEVNYNFLPPPSFSQGALSTFRANPSGSLHPQASAATEDVPNKISFHCPSGSKRVISFSLWGDGKRYTVGAVENARLQQWIYPGWRCRFYVASSVPDSVVRDLQNEGAEIVRMEDEEEFASIRPFWRFFPAADKTIDRFIVRDADSRLNIREAMAVQEWIDSGEPFHIMREAIHPRKILGGMWGAVGGTFPDMIDQCYTWALRMPEKTRGLNEQFLCEEIWPRIEHHHMCHDDSLRHPTHLIKEFPIQLEPGYFVGQIIGS